jgi:hypothetical protein
VTGWVTTHEPEWSLEDLRAALDWQAERDLICQGCGRPRDESMVHENDAPFYEVTALACHACSARDLAARDATDQRGHAPPGRYYAVKPRSG